MVLRIIVPHFPALGSRGVPPMPLTLLMSGGGQMYCLPPVLHSSVVTAYKKVRRRFRHQLSVLVISSHKLTLPVGVVINYNPGRGGGYNKRIWATSSTYLGKVRKLHVFFFKIKCL